MRYTISNPMIEDYNPGYAPEGSWELAATKGAYWTWLNGQYTGDQITLEEKYILTTSFQPTPTSVPTWVSPALSILF